jgi:hypothetical protein
MTKFQIVLASAFLGVLVLLAYSRDWNLPGIKSAFSPNTRPQSALERDMLTGALPFLDFSSAAMPQTYPRPTSEWQTNEQHFYEKLLVSHHYDVLVVPFQVQFGGFDRSTRSLMSAELTAAIARAKPGRVPDLNVIAKVFGDGRRQISIEEIRRIAGLIGAKRIIWGAVGHTGVVKGGQRKMDVALLSQERSGTSANGSWTAPIARKTFYEIPFGDDQSPVDAFELLLPDILIFLGFDPAAANATRAQYTLGVDKLPDRPLAMLSGEVNWARDAYTFLLFGELTPAHMEITRESFVEKAFLSLSHLSRDSPEYKALRARGMMLMGYRGAALKLLATPTSEEEEEVRAALDGNLTDVRRLAAKERNALKSLIENLDANRIAADFGILNVDSSLDAVKALTLPGQSWVFLAARAFTDWNPWSQFDNGSLKALLDADFPVEGYSLEGLVQGQVALGGEEKLQPIVALSAFNHVQKYIERDASQWCCDSAPGSAKPLDYLELLSAFGHDNLIRHVYFLAHMQGSPQAAISYADGIQSVYKGYPYYTLERARAERVIADRSTGAEQQGLMKAAYADAFNSMYWEQSQSMVSSAALDEVTKSGRRDYGDFDNLYSTDIPYHATYSIWDQGLRVAENWRAAVSNATSQFSVVTGISGSTEDAFADEMTQQIQGRFIGNPNREMFLADQKLLHGDLQGAEDLLRENIRMAPSFTPSYLKLGKLVFQSGQPAASEKIFLSIPEFHGAPSKTPVATANAAYEMGSLFYSSGDFEFAVPMYKIAVSQNSGAASEMRASMRLSLLEGDIEGAMASSLECAQRYNDVSSYRDYLAMLHAANQSQSAWAGFDTLIRVLQQSGIWESALVGHHMAGTSESQVSEWINQGDRQSIGNHSSLAITYLAWFATIDRVPSIQQAQMIAQLDRPTWQFDDGALSVVRPDKDGREMRILGPIGATTPHGAYPMGLFSDPNKHRVRSPLSYFVEAYRAIKLRDYREGKQVLAEAAGLYDMSNLQSSYMLPYYALASVKAGKDVGDVTRILSHLSEATQSFDSELAIAVLQGSAGKNSAALESLRRARYHRLNNEERTLISQYTYGEFCETLYELTKDPRILAEGLQWARTRERVEPWQSWSYGLEADLTNDLSDRARAIAMTYYLDPKSSRLSRFSKAEIDKAVKQFNGANIFQKHGQRPTAT